MITFSWTALSQNIFEIKIKTPIVRIGTLYRLTAAIYILGLDIISGSIDTVREGDEEFADDSFILRPSEDSEQDFAYFSSMVGVLMETLLRNEKDPDDLLLERQIDPPDIRFLFDIQPEMRFKDLEEKKTDRIYNSITQSHGPALPFDPDPCPGRNQHRTGDNTERG